MFSFDHDSLDKSRRLSRQTHKKQTEMRPDTKDTGTHFLTNFENENTMLTTTPVID